MPIEIIVPRLGWTMEEGVFVGWLKKDGEEVRPGQPLFTLDGDKALQEVEATDAGILRIPPDAPQPGSTVRVGALLGYLIGKNEAAPPQASASAASPQADKLPAPERAAPAAPEITPTPRRIQEGSTRRAITPRALRAATRLGLDWRGVQGSGRGGRVRERDLTAITSPPVPGRGVAESEVADLRVVITDWTFPNLEIETQILENAGCKVSAQFCKTESELIRLVADADAVLTQFARLTSTVIASMTRARAIVRYGIGVDNVDLEAARSRGIPVCNVPDYCIDEVADHTLGFILGATRQVVPHTAHLRAGHWGLAVPLAEMRALRDLTVGVVGFGRIGREVVRRLLAFKATVLVFDPKIPASTVEASGARRVESMDLLLPSCDIVTLHCPSTPETRRLIGAEALARFRPGAVLINVARGDLVETDALVAALESERLAGAALDVFDPEPLPAGHPLLRLSNVILAPHIASVSPKAVRKLRETAAAIAAQAALGERPANIVNGV